MQKSCKVHVKFLRLHSKMFKFQTQLHFFPSIVNTNVHESKANDTKGANKCNLFPSYSKKRRAVKHCKLTTTTPNNQLKNRLPVLQAKCPATTPDPVAQHRLVKSTGKYASTISLPLSIRHYLEPAAILYPAWSMSTTEKEHRAIRTIKEAKTRLSNNEPNLTTHSHCYDFRIQKKKSLCSVLIREEIAV